MERGILIHEIEKHLSENAGGTENDRDAMIFWLYYRTGLTASAIADLPGIDLTTKGVESLLLCLTRELRELLSKPERHQPIIAHDSKKGIITAESF
jgi:RNA polymerase sigma-70 factor (ECF subfamily)